MWMSVNPIDYSKGTKSDILLYIPEYTPKTLYVDYTTNFDFNKIKYPKIFKPNVCSGISKNVRVINNVNEAIEYHKNMNDNYLIQDISYYNNEIGLLYEKNPWTNKGKIISIYKRVFNNKLNLNIWNVTNAYDMEPYENKNNLISNELTDKINKIIDNIPNMYVCRLDIKYDNDNDFKKGEKFTILEVNGVMGYDLRFWDEDEPSYISYIIVLCWILRRLLYGFLNILLFNGANIYHTFFNIYERIFVCRKCGDWEKLFEYVYT